MTIPKSEEVARLVRDRIAITRQDVALAKSFILNSGLKDARANLFDVFELFKRHMDCDLPKEIVLTPPDWEVPLDEIAKPLRWWLTYQEAAWGLVADAILLPMSHEVGSKSVSVGYKAANTGGGWNLEDSTLVLPARVRIAPSWERAPQPLSSPDLYLRDLGIADLTPGVEESLRLAVECLRRDLYVPSIAMLGRASEGGWIELGRALAEHLSATDQGKIGTKLSSLIEDRFGSIGQKMLAVCEYAERDSHSVLQQDKRALRDVYLWSQVVRDARNSVHYSHEPATVNNYEKVATLILGAGQHIGTLFAVRRRALTSRTP
jgi:hypothetical protein